MIIREANANDLEQILVLYQFLFREEDYSATDDFRENWAGIMSHNGLTYFVAEVNGVLAATCHICVVPNLTRGQRSYALIENVVTHPDFRRKGYGRAVVMRAVEHARSENCYKVMLLSTAGDERTAAHRFYEEIGFDGDSKRGFHIRFKP